MVVHQTRIPFVDICGGKLVRDVEICKEFHGRVKEGERDYQEYRFLRLGPMHQRGQRVNAIGTGPGPYFQKPVWIRPNVLVSEI